MSNAYNYMQYSSVKYASINSYLTHCPSLHRQPQSADCYQYQYDSEVNWGSRGNLI